jgi:hypothetical protein
VAEGAREGLPYQVTNCGMSVHIELLRL